MRNKTNTLYLQNKTLKYINNKDWYNKSNEKIKSIFGNDYKLFIKLLAITSPRNSVKTNTYFALKAYKYIKLNKDIDFKFGYAHPSIYPNIKRLLNNQDIRGKKVNSFIDSLLLQDNSVCIDIWIKRIFNIKSPYIRVNKRKHIYQVIKAISRNLGLKTYQVQACLWAYSKKELNSISRLSNAQDFSAYLDKEIQNLNLNNLIIENRK